MAEKSGKSKPASAQVGLASPATLRRRSAMLAALIIAAAGILIYSNTFSNPFFFDDDRAILRNESIRRLWPIWDVLAAKPKSRPVINLSLAVNYAISGPEVWSYHTVNLAVHIVAAVALFGVLRRTLVSSRLKGLTGGAATPLALIASLMWLAHPLQTSAVTYVIQRAESMMGMFYLLTMYCAIRSLSPGARRRWAWYLCAAACCALGMGSKQVMATAPLMVLIYHRIFAARSFRQALARHAPLYVLLGATWAILLSSGDLLLSDTSAGFGMTALSPWQYARSQFGVILHYLRLSFWPVGLCLDYRWPVADELGRILPPAIAIVALLALTVAGLRHRPAAGFAGAWFFGILAVSSSIIPIADLAFEHRMYLPLAGLISLTVVGAFALARAAAGKLISAEAKGRLAVAACGTVLATAIAAALGALAYARNAQYGNLIDMWADVAAKRPDNARAHYNLGRSYGAEGRIAEAIPAYQKAISIEPDYADAHCNLGNALMKTGRLDEALRHYGLSLKHKDRFAERTELAAAYNNAANALDQQGKYQQGIAYHLAAIDTQPDLPHAHYDLANTLCALGKYDMAVPHFRLAIANGHRFSDPIMLARAHNNMGNALMQLSRPKEALASYQQAIHVNPEHVSAHINIAVVWTQLGRYRDAAASYRRLLEIDPNHAEAHYRLGDVLVKAGDGAGAIEAYEQAVRARPDSASAANKLAWILAAWPVESLRDGPRAVKLAERVCAAADFKDPRYLETLAAAYAQAGQFDRAIASAELAVKLTEASEPPETAERRTQSLRLYRQHKPPRVHW